MAKLWTKSEAKLAPLVERFCFEKDVALDTHLVYYDILGSLAHATMLKKIGIMNAKELTALKKKLRGLYASHLKGRWQIEVSDEDVHTAVESRLGKVGEKLHTARSRNDQVQTDMRLFMKEKLIAQVLAQLELAQLMTKLAKKYEFVPMPGYTHLQRAMPSSFGMWMGAFAEALHDASFECEGVFQLIDTCPLGSGAGYGVSLDIDRQLTADLLGFSRVQRNSIYCQNSRGHFEAALLGSLASSVSICSRLASDVCLFCSQEFSFLKLPDSMFTGSSIMPQKKNPDLFELVRAKGGVVASIENKVRGVSQGLGSGYSKDLQEVKEPLMEGIDIAEQVFAVVTLAIKDLQPNREALKAAMSPELFATDKAYELVKAGMPFRRAYHHIKGSLDELEQISPEANIRSKSHLGSTGRLQLSRLERDLKKVHGAWASRGKKMHQVWNRLLNRKA